MSFNIGSVYFLVNVKKEYFLFVPRTTSTGTIYAPGPDLLSAQYTRQAPMSWPSPPVLSIHLTSLVNDGAKVDNHVNRIVVEGDRGTPQRSIIDWWFDLMTRLYDGGIVELENHELAHYIRRNTEAAVNTFLRTAVRTSIVLGD